MSVLMTATASPGDLILLKIIECRVKFIKAFLSAAADSLPASPAAFTTVSARRAFPRPEPVLPPQSYHVPPADPPKPEKPKREWPPAVRQYVQRSFAVENNIPGIGRGDMEMRLKKVISDAAESNTLLTVDWDNLPLPQQMIQTDRLRVDCTNVASTWRDQFSILNVQETNGSSNVPLSKKRKSSDLAHAPVEQKLQPPWRTNNGPNVLEERVTYADKRQRNDVVGKTPSKSQFSLETRRRRFEGGANGFLSTQPCSPKEDSPMPDVEQGPVVGRSQDLEKTYFRLTSAPNPDTVRPLPVLEKTLDHLKKKWKKENNYSYICDQFKSLRQDLTVQHIKNDFTVNVYEIHARIALEKGDLGEYNQCQTQLRALYAQNLGGHPNEFKAYRILYFIHTCNRTDMNDVLADLTPAEKKALPIKHALDARSALALGNYHRFFQLYLETPNMGAYLMDMFVARQRLAALTNICKAYIYLYTMLDHRLTVQ